MKRLFSSIIAGAACMTLASTAHAQLGLVVTSVFGTTTTMPGQATGGAFNAFAYHAPSNKCIIAGTGNPWQVPVFSGDTGASVAPTTMTLAGTESSLGIFALGTANSGQIVGFDNDNTAYVTWTSPSDTAPTSYTIQAANGFTSPTVFARNMDIADVATVASGTQTLMAVSGGGTDGNPLEVDLRNSNTSYQRVALLGGLPYGSGGSKAGATISDDGQWIIGCSSVSAAADNQTHVFRNGTGGPISSYNWVNQGDVVPATGAALDVAVDSSNDVGFSLKASAATPTIILFRLSNRTQIGSTIIPAPAGVTSFGTARGGLDVDKNQKRIYWCLQANANAVVAFGRLDYNYQLTAASDWALYQ